MSIQEIEAAIEKLPPDELQAFLGWIDRYREEASRVEAPHERHWIGGEQPNRADVKTAVEHLKTLREGVTLGSDLTIRQLIDEGRA